MQIPQIRPSRVALTLVALLFAPGIELRTTKVSAQPANEIQAPVFEVDPFWPKPLPNHWVLGRTIGVSVDAQDHVWITHRVGTLEETEKHATTNPPTAECCVPAPPVLEFDQAGNLLRSWGGPGKGYDWPESLHGITIDYKGNVWLGGQGRGRAADGSLVVAPSDEGVGAGTSAYNDNSILKFTSDGQFLLQIGKPHHSQGSNDVENLRLPAKTFVDKQANEVYVADGYGNHRIIVFDANTGKYKRHWGAYGNRPDDAYLGKYDPKAPPSKQFGNPVHCADLAVDRLLYVCDRRNDRLQVFKTDGTFVKEAILFQNTLGAGSVWDVAFSKDLEQKYLYVADGENEQVHILLRSTLEVLTSFGDGGRQPGEFYGVHSIAADSKGNLYTTETYRGQRVQKFIYKGIAPVTKKNQGVPWPTPLTKIENAARDLLALINLRGDFPRPQDFTTSPPMGLLDGGLGDTPRMIEFQLSLQF
jgi:DNA-binding beta-propeller fold protein YncE